MRNKNLKKMSLKLEKLLDKVEKDIKEGRNLSPAFNSGKKMDKYLKTLR